MTNQLTKLYKELPLSQGKVTEVDFGDFAYLNQWKWHYDCSGGGCVSASRMDYSDGWKNPKKIYMHRVILDAPVGITGDHKNGNGLDNRRVNLRLATMQQQSFNKRKTRKTSSRYKGVSRRGNRWYALIGYNWGSKYLGAFREEDEAAIAYNNAARELYGEFAKLNIVEGYDD